MLDARTDASWALAFVSKCSVNVFPAPPNTVTSPPAITGASYNILIGSKKPPVQTWSFLKLLPKFERLTAARLPLTLRQLLLSCQQGIILRLHYKAAPRFKRWKSILWSLGDAMRAVSTLDSNRPQIHMVHQSNHRIVPAAPCYPWRYPQGFVGGARRGKRSQLRPPFRAQSRPLLGLIELRGMAFAGVGRLWVSGLPERPSRVWRRQATYP